jgi:anti-sigma-K factor RskA
MTPHDPREAFEDDGDLLAAEYALGVLDATRRREAAVRVEVDPAFAAEVARWEARFAPWLDAITPVPAPATVWERVRDTLWTENPPRAPAVPLWQRLGFWRGLAIGSAALAAAAVGTVFLLARRPPPVPPAPDAATAQLVVVSLRHQDGSTA